ncbi:hypothetical protein [Epilithonimonas hispanica]|uniref:Lipopolysaccharide biosynthesis protein n=1 Tax=Epilithonimonas hispanica TaxID=358687 RepID=A0A3D9D2A0_9FLAO|nr:hypothetical protein [Epilithonimonas hispanica]REC72067.1 hypothetical protein DRF58_03710 [Epilithonimonas hispanica]
MDNQFAGKTILIGIANYVGLPERFQENLEFLGFKVIVLKHDTSRVPIPLKDSIIHIYKKFILNDKTHKQSTRNKIKETIQLDFLERINEKIDYALFTRPDLFSIEVIKKVNQLSGKSIAYQWDGIDRYPTVKKYFNLFDKFFVFDINDTNKNPNLIFTTNFYFDDLISTKHSIEKKSVFFVGSAMKDRFKTLNDIALKLKQLHLIPNFFIYNYGKKKIDKNKNYNFSLLIEPLSFKSSIIEIQKSDFLLDLHNPAHNGLSFRTFESLGYKKKLITNNSLVKDYDFYNPNNIFIFQGNDFSGIEDFMKSPYELYNDNIYKKYSFTNWIDNILK